MLTDNITEAITFDDVLVLPNRSDIMPSEVDTRTYFSRNVELNIPFSSAAMDTVTESRMAIALAREGGIGIIHKNMSVDDQVREVDIVKRSANGVIVDPVTLPPSAPISRAREVMTTHTISGVPIVKNRKVVGILTNRDLRFQWEKDLKVEEIMTRDLVTAPAKTSLADAEHILHKHKVEKLILTNDAGELLGLITMRDIKGLKQFPAACRDERGRLRVGAAVGVFDLDRCDGLIEAGCDVLVVDTAHGHSRNVIETVREIKRSFKIDVAAGNIATKEAAEDLVAAGVDAVKVGIGPGSICTTRVVTGIGMPQVTAVASCAAVAKPAGVPVIADGGIRASGDVVKAIVAGANSVMMGSLFAGMDESPGESVIFKGRSFKTIRGMGSLGAMMDGSSDRYRQSDSPTPEKLVPEGVEGLVPYKGALSTFVYQLVGGVRSGMGYTGAETLEQLYTRGRFIRVSPATLRENHPHDIQITREAPNYFVDS